MLPEGWKETTLERYIHVKHGYAFKGEYFSTSGKYIVLTPGNFFESGGFRDQKDKTKYYSGEIPKEYLLKKGDCILAMTEQGAGLLGSAAFIPDNNKFLHNQRIGLIEVIDPHSVSLDFLYWLYNDSKNRLIISNEAGGTKVKHTSPKKLVDISILLPPLPEQKKIAAILSTWDRAIEGTEKLLANSQQQKKALMQQLLTGKKRLLGFTGEWKSLKLKTFLQESMIPSPQPDPKKRITVRLSLKGVEKREVRGTESIDATNYFTRKAGQFIYGKQNIHKGAFGIIPKTLDGFETSQDIPCFDFLPDRCPAWLFYYLARENIHNTLETKMTGTGSKRLNQKTFLSLTCLAPPLPEQKAIAAVLTTADEEITTLESDLSRLRQEKKALMQQLLTGKRRVKVD